MHTYTRTLNTPVGRRSLSSRLAKPKSGDVVTCQPRLAGAYFSPAPTCAGNRSEPLVWNWMLEITSLVPRLSGTRNKLRMYKFNFSFRSGGAWERG